MQRNLKIDAMEGMRCEDKGAVGALSLIANMLPNSAHRVVDVMLGFAVFIAEQ